MGEKKDFLQSIAEELENKGKNTANSDNEIYHASSKNAAELRNYKEQSFEFDNNNEPRVAPSSASRSSVQSEAQAPNKVSEVPPVTPPPVQGKALDSFKQEELKKVDKKPVNKKGIIAAVLVLLALLVMVWFFFFAPKIVMPDFTGKSVNEVGAWAKQNNISTSGIIINTEYNLEYDKDVIISQVTKPGKKIKKDAALTFIASKGADPDEVIDFPNIMSMNYAEIKDWIDTNKLAKTKINTQYNTLVEKDAVINYDLKTGTESNFTRGSTLTINVSKGPAPAGTVAVENFVGKTFVEAEQWANTKKVLIEKSEVYSDTIEIGKIISQSIKVGESLEEGGTLSVTVSKGKAVKIPNLVGYTSEMLEAWAATPENKVTIVKKERYNVAMPGTVVGQSLKAGSQVDQGTVLELTISLYMPQLETNSRAWYGKDYLELIKWVDDANAKGANLAAGPWEIQEASDEYSTPGQIIEYRCLDASGNQLSYGANGCARPLPLDAKISMKISTGPSATNAPASSATLTEADMSSIDTMTKFCNTNGMACTFVYVNNGGVISVKSGDQPVGKDTVLAKGTALTIEY